jgi:LysR family transcriptional regulator, transcriptional activator of the cysJI operon
MELRLLQTFAAVAELRHFARAAERCNLSQPAVSHQIRQLEEDLGTKLLNRSGRHVSLTVAGELFLEDARRILAAVDRARERVQSVSVGTVGRVRLGATETAGLYILPALLERYRRTHPRFALQFTIAPEVEILERVASNDLDMGVISGKPALGELRSRRIARDEMVVVASPSAPVAKRRRLTRDQLREEAWLLREDGSDTRRHLDAWFRRNHLSPHRLMTLPGPDAVKRGVVAGLGIGLLARVVVADELKSGQLVALQTAASVGVRDVLLVDHPQKHHGAACTAMIGMLTVS